jgi:AraC-like DNA-binding protein
VAFSEQFSKIIKLFCNRAGAAAYKTIFPQKILAGKSVFYIAGVLGVSAESLHRKFNKITGSTPKNFAAGGGKKG